MSEESGIGAGRVVESAAERAVRTNLFIAAVLEWDGSSVPVTVRNLSETGALVEGAVLPSADGNVRLVRGKLAAAGTAVWVKDRRCGLALAGPLPVALWMAKPANVGQAAIDAEVRRIKAGHVVPLTSPPMSAGAPSLEACIRELEAQLAEVSDALVSASETVARHAEQLVTLDLLAQGLARLRARVIASGREPE